MDKRLFYAWGIGVGVVSFLLSFFAMPVEGIVVGIVSLIMNLRKRKEHRILIGMIFTVLGMVSAIAFLALLVYNEMNGIGESSYWFCRLLFG